MVLASVQSEYYHSNIDYDADWQAHDPGNMPSWRNVTFMQDMWEY